MKRLVLTIGAMASVALFGTATPVQATPITYTEQAVATGRLGASAFTNALVTLSLTTDTSAVTGPPGFSNVIGGTATVNVAGLGTATFTDPISILDNNGFLIFPPSSPVVTVQAIGFVDVGVGFILLTFDPAFLSYDLRSSIGPVSGGAFFGEFIFDQGYSTTSGNFHISSVSGPSVPPAFQGNSTFTATLGPQATVPEPASIILLGTGLVAVARRRFKKRV
jgi:hypothetical protein